MSRCPGTSSRRSEVGYYQSRYPSARPAVLSIRYAGRKSSSPSMSDGFTANYSNHAHDALNRVCNAFGCHLLPFQLSGLCSLISYLLPIISTSLSLIFGVITLFILQSVSSHQQSSSAYNGLEWRASWVGAFCYLSAYFALLVVPSYSEIQQMKLVLSSLQLLSPP